MTFFLGKIFYAWMNAMDVLCHIACVVAATLGKSNGCTLRTPQLYLHSILLAMLALLPKQPWIQIA